MKSRKHFTLEETSEEENLCNITLESGKYSGEMHQRKGDLQAQQKAIKEGERRSGESERERRESTQREEEEQLLENLDTASAQEDQLGVDFGVKKKERTREETRNRRRTFPIPTSTEYGTT